MNSKGVYDFIAIYVDDLLVVALDPTSIIAAICAIFNLKGEGFPDYYLEVTLKRRNVSLQIQGRQ